MLQPCVCAKQMRDDYKPILRVLVVVLILEALQLILLLIILSFKLIYLKDNENQKKEETLECVINMRGHRTATTLPTPTNTIYHITIRL